MDDNEATLKRLRRRGDSALEAANPAYETRLYGADRVKVQGKLVELIGDIDGWSDRRECRLGAVGPANTCTPMLNVPWTSMPDFVGTLRSCLEKASEWPHNAYPTIWLDAPLAPGGKSIIDTGDIGKLRIKLQKQITV